MILLYVITFTQNHNDELKEFKAQSTEEDHFGNDTGDDPQNYVNGADHSNSDDMINNNGNMRTRRPSYTLSTNHPSWNSINSMDSRDITHTIDKRILTELPPVADTSETNNDESKEDKAQSAKEPDSSDYVNAENGSLRRFYQIPGDDHSITYFPSSSNNSYRSLISADTVTSHTRGPSYTLTGVSSSSASSTSYDSTVNSFTDTSGTNGTIDGRIKVNNN